MSIVDLRAAKAGQDLELSWSPVTQTTAGETSATVAYNIYRTIDPSAFPLYNTGSGTIYIAPGALANPDIDYYYCVCAVDGGGQESTSSNQVGFFQLAVMPGRQSAYREANSRSTLDLTTIPSNSRGPSLPRSRPSRR